ncbi:hypothetical protein HBI25_224460 [Parastagonospora nodorum]|nr:hypothetical protein HBI12_188030 [Parastagonospora nodorum]KAH5325011.1 hypothetical protein HBI11_022200 [Parastagonospora nodorum]KAH5545295.1 hypothetical protein HBI25_224460 [Parastagonospora nodorum]KAH5672430.1 hypothetical protein HBI21_166630 [Parastagonospora nodorum]KAH6054066.1 hypothetical protein HBI67_197910 [Parastagonospora nodorum]
MPSQSLASAGVPTPRVRKRQRASLACDFCHGRGLKCRQSAANGRQDLGISNCLTCMDYGVACTINRPLRRRGRKPMVRQVEVHLHDSRYMHQFQDQAESDYANSSDDASACTLLRHIRRLVRIYCDTMYQCYFPFLPESDLLTRWEDGPSDPDSPSYMLLMALCAVSSQTASLNAVFDDKLLRGAPIPTCEHYFNEAISKIPTRMTQSQDLDYLRAFGLLAVYSLQRGNHNDLHRYLGLYHALVAQHGFHDESRWPKDLSITEVDDRRRLFWCMYRLEVHSACVLGHIVRMPESQISVLYPRIFPTMDPEKQAWTAGWDYITDLFRLLEYAIFSLRGCKNRKAALAVFCERPSPATLLDGLARLKSNKPRILLDPDDNFQSNRCRYMAVQITCTETLVNIMALLYCQAPACEIMEITKALIEEMESAPLIMFKVAGSQIVHQLLGVGHMLFNASRYEHGQQRAEAERLIAFLGDLVKNLELDIPSAAEAGERLQRLAETSS